MNSLYICNFLFYFFNSLSALITDKVIVGGYDSINDANHEPEYTAFTRKGTEYQRVSHTSFFVNTTCTFLLKTLGAKKTLLFRCFW